MGNVAELRPIKTIGRMENDELRDRYQKIEATTKDYRRALLFAEARSRGRTQAEIADVVNVKKSYVSYLITFADFIGWFEISTMVETPKFRLYEVTERKFRTFWNNRRELKGNVNERRRAVLSDLIDHQNERDRHDNSRYVALVKALKDNKLISGRRYRVETMAKRTGFEADVIKGFLVKHQKSTSHGLQAERIAENTYRIHPATSKRKVDPEVILSKIKGYLEELDAMKDYPIGTQRIAPMHIGQLAYLIEKAIKEFC